jgi:hypothetical protein
MDAAEVPYDGEVLRLKKMLFATNLPGKLTVSELYFYMFRINKKELYSIIMIARHSITVSYLVRLIFVRV